MSNSRRFYATLSPPRPPVVCVHCGHTKFKKGSLISCSAMPPFFKCAKCNKFQPGSVNFAISPTTGWSVLTQEGFFVGHLHCHICGVEIEDFDLDALPRGWIIEETETKDPIGNPMWKKYAYCSDH